MSIPRNNYKLQIKEATNAPSKNTQRPMMTLVLEIVECANDALNGKKVTHRCMLDAKGFATSFPSNFNILLGAINDVEMEPVSVDDAPDYPADQLIDRTLFARLNEKQEVVKDENGDPVLNPNTGEEATQPRVNIEMLFPRA